ncbi:TolC family protein [uncultured Bacteroides sp.]|uniref:TolC family protein n=1 Tax=uncultured Bacteroides sp. TaxID=162156 RepID=UPI0025CC2FAF|nr:TolC family protein [uncultured Bacteroides sp.]
MKKDSIALFTAMVCACSMQAQTVEPITYKQYMHKVSMDNLEYAAEKMNVSAAHADVIAARVFDDPSLSFTYSNNEDHTLQMGQSYELGLSQNVTLGKRTAGIRLARSQSELAEIVLNDYFRNLQADATISYLEVMKQKQLYDIKRSAWSNMYDLAQSDSIRLASGKIMEVEAIQSKLEADIMYNEVLQAETNLKQAYMQLSLFTGTAVTDTLFHPVEELKKPEQAFVLGALIETAVEHRSDLLAALKNTEVARRELTLTKREKRPDVEFSLGWSHNKRVRNEEAPAPAFNGVSAGIAIPLNFSSLNRGAVNAARFRARQAELQYEQMCLQVQQEVMGAYQQFQSQTLQLKHYEGGILKQAQDVLEGKIYSYNRGEVSLLEILNAQRTYNEVQAQYIETLFNYNAALVELERSCGIWDIKG